MKIQKSTFYYPYSSGKTFTLLLYTNFDIKNNRKAYFNLEVLENNAKYLEIIAYESRRLFKHNKSWKNAFEWINENILEKPLSILKYLIDSVCSKDEDNKIKYTFILDQIKFWDNSPNNTEFQAINSIRHSLSKTKNCFLIRCYSMNYKGVKNIIFKKWFRVDQSSEDIDIHYIIYAQL